MKKIFIIILMMISFIPSFVMAAGEVTNDPVKPSTGTTENKNIIKWKLTNPLQNVGGDSIADVIKAVIDNIFMPLVSMLVVLALLYSGFKFVIAQGNSAELQKAREGLLWVLVGSLLLLGAQGISTALKSTLESIVGK